MSDSIHEHTTCKNSHEHHCRHSVPLGHLPPRLTQGGLLPRLAWLWRYLWFIVFKNRFSIAVASLVWLIWRSGTQPRRMAYPCQQAAAANLGFLAVLFVPQMAKRRANPHSHMRRAVGLATGSVALAGVLFLLIDAGKAVYSSYLVGQLAASIPAPSVPPPPATVSIKHTSLTTLTTADIEAMVREAVALAGGLSGIIQPGNTVGIKPNLVNDNMWTPAAPTGVTTDPRVVAAVVKLAKEAGAGTVKIIEGAAGPAVWGTSDPNELGRGITWLAYQNCGYDTNGDHLFDYDTTVALVDLNDAGTGGLVPRPITTTPPGTVKIHLNNGVIRTDYYIPKAILTPAQGGTCDILITVPTLKNHGNGGITAALKSHVGIAPSDIYHDTVAGHTNQMKRDLVHRWGATDPFPRNVTGSNPGSPPDENTCVNYSTVDLNLVRPNDFAVVDGLVGITNGPTGTTKPNPLLNLIMAGKDSVAVDTISTLAMGYDPLQILQIGWAWNRGLGNRDTSSITVVGDHVAPIRALVTNSFPGGYGGTVKISTTPPTLGNLTPLEGATVAGDVTVTGSGLSSGITKAELTVKLTSGLNLVTNGDFEQGQAGWTSWRESGNWGSGEVTDYGATPDAGHGSKCLRLTASTGSFGAYQQIPVTPGHTYRIDGYWNGKRVGDYQWYEILLIDGPFSLPQADCDACGVRDNYMYAYDANTYGLSVPVGNSFGWIWAHQQNAPPNNQVDWNNRAGLRTATGNTMTVVLKCGACCGTSGPDARFDDVSLVEVGSEQLVATLQNPTDPFNMIWHSTTWPNGNYDLKTTVYDVNLNEASITRHVFKTDESRPSIVLNPTTFTHTIGFGTDPNPASESFTVSNQGIGTLNYAIGVTYDPGDPPWLSVSPPTGSTTGPANTHTITYSTISLAPGTHTATLLVSDNGSLPGPPLVNKSITVTMTINTVKADFNQDGFVDQSDFAHFQVCMTGAGNPVTPESCRDTDLMKDNDVDAGDLALFMQCFTGPLLYVPAGCDSNYP